MRVLKATNAVLKDSDLSRRILTSGDALALFANIDVHKTTLLIIQDP